jgi:hypothetical protein
MFLVQSGTVDFSGMSRKCPFKAEARMSASQWGIVEGEVYTIVAIAEDTNMWTVSNGGTAAQQGIHSHTLRNYYCHDFLD